MQKFIAIAQRLRKAWCAGLSAALAPLALARRID
jgi:hypothetical protein